MNQFRAIAKIASVCLMLLLLTACVTQQTRERNPLSQANATRDALSCEEVFETQTADSYPTITWDIGINISEGKAVGCLLTKGERMNTATNETVEYLSSGLYSFISECREDGGAFRRVFEYKNKDRPYLLRFHTNPLVDPYTYIVVGSYPKKSDAYNHSIIQKANDSEKIILCHTK